MDLGDPFLQQPGGDGQERVRLACDDPRDYHPDLVRIPILRNVLWTGGEREVLWAYKRFQHPVRPNVRVEQVYSIRRAIDGREFTTDALAVYLISPVWAASERGPHVHQKCELDMGIRTECHYNEWRRRRR